MKPLLIKDSIFLEHDTGEHPESIKRLIAINSAITPLEPKLVVTNSYKATKEETLFVHTNEHYNRVKEYAAMQKPLDADTLTSKRSFEVALYAAGAGISEPGAVSQLGAMGPSAVEEILLELCQTKFERANSGNLKLTLEAAHSVPRIIYTGDFTGRTITESMQKVLLEFRCLIVKLKRLDILISLPKSAKKRSLIV